MLQDNVLYCVDLSVNVDDVFDVDVDVEVHNFVLYRFEDFEPHKRIFFSYVKESHVFSYDDDTSLCKKNPDTHCDDYPPDLSRNRGKACS